MCGAYAYSVKDEKEVYDRFEVTNTLGASLYATKLRTSDMFDKHGLLVL